MTIPPGSQFGPYTIVGPLGAGGMGEVYRARDSRLGREVAIKVLPPSASADAGRLQRFEQEARAAAALNHPNILALFDIGHSDSGPYIVSELLDGKTLRDAIDAGELPARKAIDCAIQIARGLAAAHDKGIVHRDLKPENVFVTTSGHAKILDFGLAKLLEPEVALTSGSLLPTTPPVTTPGVVLGTVGYMAPEQVRGQVADHRADIFAFGAVLYEMLSGRRAFSRETPAETMTAVLKNEPEELPSSVSPGLQRIVLRCLEKNPGTRFQSSGDLAFALEALSASSTQAAVVASPPRETRLPSARVAWAVAAVSVIALAAATWIYTRPVAREDRLIRFTFSLPEGWHLDVDTSTADIPVRLSPDGRFALLRGVDDEGRTSLWIRSLDALDLRQVPGTAGAMTYFWSPDSRSIAFVAGGKLQRLEIAGGSPVLLADAEGMLGGTWGTSGVILLGSYAGILQVPAAGGQVTTALALGKDEAFFTAPRFLNDGRHFLFLVGVGSAIRGGAERRVALASLGSPERTVLFDTNQFLFPLGFSRGNLLFVRGNAVMAQPFDESKLSPTGEAVQVANGIQRTPNRPYGIAAVSDTGVLAYVQETQAPTHQLAWFDRSGRQTAIVGERANYSGVEISPDGSRVALAVLDAAKRTRDVWLLDLQRTIRTRFTFHPGEERTAIWSSTGDRVVFNSQRKGTERDLFVKPSNGSGNESALLADGLSKDPMSVSPDGKLLLYRVSSKNRNDIWVLPLDGTGKPYPFLETPSDENYGRFSPDGKWVAYTADESGQPEVYVVPFPGSGGKWQISAAGGSFPRWKGNGRELFYEAPDGSIMSAVVDGTTPAFRAEAPRRLFHAPIAQQAGYQYGVSADGERFLINTAIASSVPVAVVSDWTLLLKK